MDSNTLYDGRIKDKTYRNHSAWNWQIKNTLGITGHRTKYEGNRQKIDKQTEYILVSRIFLVYNKKATHRIPLGERIITLSASTFDSLRGMSKTQGIKI